jgi:chromosome segregation ATPase
LRAARDVLEAGGRPASGTTLERVGTNLRAAAVSDDQRDALLQGRLVEDLEPAGFEALARSAAAARSERKASPSAAKRSRIAQRLKAARLKAEQAEAEAESLERTVARAEDELATAKRAARDAERRLESSRSKAERARNRAERAAATLRDLEAD